MALKLICLVGSRANIQLVWCGGAPLLSGCWHRTGPGAKAPIQEIQRQKCPGGGCARKVQSLPRFSGCSTSNGRKIHGEGGVNKTCG